MADAIDSEVSDELFHTANNHIYESIDKVYTQKELEDYQTVNELKRNASEFAIRKASYYTQAMKGKEPEVQTAIMNTYERQLQVEANFATRATRSAKQWQEYQRKKHIYPNLEYMPSSSADPRLEHEMLYGTILPLDDPFWDTNFPPNDWGCKCSTAASRGDATGTPENIPELPKGIPGNPGKELKVFSDNNSFERRLSKEGKKNIKKQLESKKQEIPYGKPNFKFKNGKTLSIHPYADRSEPEFTRNLEVGKRIVGELGIEVKLRPHINNRVFSSTPNPEYTIGGKIADRKAVEGLKFSNVLRKANNIQKTEVVVIDLIDNPYSIREVLSKLRNNFKFDANYPLIKQVIIISKDRKDVKIYDRVEIKKG